MKLVTFFSDRYPGPCGSDRVWSADHDKRAERTDRAGASKIEKQTGYVFFYDTDDIESLNVSIVLKNAIDRSNLKECFKGLPVTYKIVDNTIVIRKKDVIQRKIPDEARFIEPLKIQPAEIKVSGTVTDEKGSGLPGVSILIKGASLGTLSDISGKYQLSVPNANAVLVFSFVGFNTQEVTVGNKSVIDISLSPDIKGLQELVVVGYGTQKKVNLTGAITAVSAAELNTQAASNLSNTLAGRAPGVNVTNTSGLAGASSTIRMRGSFGDPLYVIDGIVRDRDAFDMLEAAEVDQLSFLKDAATASIYGSRAGNGVVMVTTKTGVKQKPTFNLQSNTQRGRPTQTLLSDLTTAEDELIYQNRVAQFNGTPIPNKQREFDYFKDKKYNVNDFIWQTLTVTGIH